MHVLVATAGVLPPEPVARLTEVLAGPEGRVTVMNVTQAPCEFMGELGPDDWFPFDSDEGEPPPPSRTLSEIDRYVEERGSKMVAPVVAALENRRMEPTTVFVEGDDAAEAIVAAADRLEADIIMLGTTRRLFEESTWTSISMKVAAASRCPVLLIPAPAKPAAPDAEEN